MNTIDRGRRRRSLGSQRGLSLVETLVALGLFALTAGTMGSYLVQQIRMCSTNYLYTQAYALAETELESIRAQRFVEMAPESKTARVGDATFTLATQILDDTPSNGLKRVTVNVNWNDTQGPRNVAVQAIYADLQHY